MRSGRWGKSLIGKNRDLIQTHIGAVNVWLVRVDALETKMDHMESLLVKNYQVQADMFDYLKSLEGKITHPTTPEPVTPSANYMIQEQELLLKLHEINLDIQSRARALPFVQVINGKTSETIVLDGTPQRPE